MSGSLPIMKIGTGSTATIRFGFTLDIMESRESGLRAQAINPAPFEKDPSGDPPEVGGIISPGSISWPREERLRSPEYGFPEPGVWRGTQGACSRLFHSSFSRREQPLWDHSRL